MAADTSIKEKTIRKEYVPDEAEYAALKKVYDRKQAMGDAREKFEGIWERSMNQWHAYRSVKGEDEWKSNIVIPITGSIIEAQMSEFVNQELMPYAVERGSEDKPKATAINAVLDYTWDVSKSKIVLNDAIHSALITGTAIIQDYYLKMPKKVKVKDGKGYKTVTVNEYDNCAAEEVKLEDFYIDERARAFSGPYAAVDCIRRYIMDEREAKNFFTGDWDPLGNAKFIKCGGDLNYYEFYKPPERLDHLKEVETLWYWNRVEDELIIVVNDVVVVNGPNPYKHKRLPFIRVIDNKVPHQFYGKGEAELLESLQEEINTLRRMIIDRNHLDIDRPILVSDTLTIEDEDTITRPHGVIPVGDVNAAKVMEYSDIPASVFKSLEMLNDDKIRVTGMDERQQSVSAAGTATEAAILKEATLKRLGMKIAQIKEETIVDWGQIRVCNIMQYYSQKKLEMIMGEAAVAKAKTAGILVTKGDMNFQEDYRTIPLDGQKIVGGPDNAESMPIKGRSFFKATPDFFMPSMGGYDIRYKATSDLPISKPLEMQKADEMYDRLVTNPTMDPFKLASYLIESRGKDPDDFKKDAPGTQGPPVNLQKMIDLAGNENAEMMQGKPIKSTPYASPAHTQIHLEFISSKKFKEDVPPELTEKILKLFSDHVMGEMAAQQARGEGGGPQGGAQGTEMPQGGGPMPSGEAGMEEVAPGRMMGGNDVESGLQGTDSGMRA